MSDIDYIDQTGSYFIIADEREPLCRKAKRAAKAIFKRKQVKKMRPER